MSNGQMDLRVKILTLPFTEYEYYIHDYIDEIIKKNSYEKYYQSLCSVVEKNCRLLNRRQTIFSIDELMLLFEKYFSFHKLADGKI